MLVNGELTFYFLVNGESVGASPYLLFVHMFVIWMAMHIQSSETCIVERLNLACMHAWSLWQKQIMNNYINSDQLHFKTAFPSPSSTQIKSVSDNRNYLKFRIIMYRAYWS